MKRWPTALATALILTAGTAVALPAISAGTAKTISGCVNKNSGVMRIAKTCSKSEARLIWNIQGQPGVDGKDGLPGANGSSGSNGSNGSNGLDGANGLDGSTGPNGEPGLSAFQIAENSGFTGTEETWLESLRSPVQKNIPMTDSITYLAKLPVFNNNYALFDSSDVLISFTDVVPGVYSLDFFATFTNNSSATAIVYCPFGATNPAQKDALSTGISAPMRFLFAGKAPAGKYSGFDDSKHAIVSIYSAGAYSVRCVALANDLDPVYSSTDVTLMQSSGTLIKVGDLPPVPPK